MTRSILKRIWKLVRSIHHRRNLLENLTVLEQELYFLLRETGKEDLALPGYRVKQFNGYVEITREELKDSKQLEFEFLRFLEELKTEIHT